MLRKTATMAVVMVLALASLASAELSPKYKDWPDTPAGYLLTRKEAKAYKKLDTDAQAEKFIALFWAQRDPDLTSRVNAFKVEFDSRVAEADKMFSYEDTKGSMTDRGRMLILLGPPNEASVIQNGPGKSQIESRMTTDKGTTQVWVYKKDRLPADVRQDEVYAFFRESRLGQNDFALDRSDRRNALAMKIEGDAPERLLLHPDLETVPDVGYLPGSKAATAEQLAVFSQEPRPWPEHASVLSTEGMISPAIHPLWVYLQLPNDVPAATEAVGRVTDKANGQTVGTFALPLTPLSIAGARGYDFSLPLDVGQYSFDLALLNGATPLAVKTIEASIEAVPAEGTYISPFYWGVDVRQETQAHLGDAFNLGGWHVIPRVTDAYLNSEQLAYFCFVDRPGLDEQKQPKFQVSLAVFRGDKKLQATPFVPANVSHLYEDTWMFGNALPLHIFHRTAEVRLEITLKDTISNATYTAKIPVTVVVPTAAPASPAPSK